MGILGSAEKSRGVQVEFHLEVLFIKKCSRVRRIAEEIQRVWDTAGKRKGM